MFDHVVFGVSGYEASKAFFLAAFVVGPDGRNIKAVCHEPEI
ncbi:hypothetical protein [Dyella sp. GSA-30]|nr:hypothetical protein [Dyella sp. GSA-30]